MKFSSSMTVEERERAKERFELKKDCRNRDETQYKREKLRRNHWKIKGYEL